MTSFNLLCTVAHNCHSKTKNLTAKTKHLTAKPKTSRQKQNTLRQNPHGKIKDLTAKPKLHSKNQIPHGKSKYPRQNQSYFAFAVKYLVLPWGFWFCLEVFGFSVTLVGHHRVSKMALKKWNTNLCWNIPSGQTRLPFQMFHCSGCSRNFKLERRTKNWSCFIYFPTGFSGIFL